MPKLSPDKSSLCEADIIHFNQNAYVKSRTILDAVRTIDDILEHTQRKRMNRLLVAIDFQKAFWLSQSQIYVQGTFCI